MQGSSTASRAVASKWSRVGDHMTSEASFFSPGLMSPSVRVDVGCIPAARP